MSAPENYIEKRLRINRAALPMLAALKTLVRERGIRDGRDDTLLPEGMQPPDIAAAMRAIAKATGADA